MKRIILTFLAMFLLFTGCFRHYRHGENSWTQRWVESRLSLIEVYLGLLPHDLATFEENFDFSCNVKEAIVDMEIITGVQAYKDYEITGTKLSKEDSSFLAQDLQEWKTWYKDNKQHLFFSKDYEVVFEKGDVKRIIDLPATKCHPLY